MDGLSSQLPTFTSWDLFEVRLATLVGTLTKIINMLAKFW